MYFFSRWGGWSPTCCSFANIVSSCQKLTKILFNCECVCRKVTNFFRRKTGCQIFFDERFFADNQPQYCKRNVLRRMLNWGELIHWILLRFDRFCFLQQNHSSLQGLLYIIFLSDGKFDNWMGVRKRTNWNLPLI